MKKMTQDEMNEILKLHKMWLNGEKNGVRAVIEARDLFDLTMIGANLQKAVISRSFIKNCDMENVDMSNTEILNTTIAYSNMENATLASADMINANMTEVYMPRSNLYKAIIYESTMRDCDIEESNFEQVTLRYSIVKNCNLEKSNMTKADLPFSDMLDCKLTFANLQNANVCYANLTRTRLTGANLTNLIWNSNTANFGMNCPEEGSFIGFKRAGMYIVKLEILADAKRSSSTSRKCRCSAAKVLSITNLDGSEAAVTEVASDFDSTFIYRVGEIVSSYSFDENRWKQCATGIHFFITRDEAVNYCG